MAALGIFDYKHRQVHRFSGFFADFLHLLSEKSRGPQRRRQWGTSATRGAGIFVQMTGSCSPNVTLNLGLFAGSRRKPPVYEVPRRSRSSKLSTWPPQQPLARRARTGTSAPFVQCLFTSNSAPASAFAWAPPNRQDWGSRPEYPIISFSRELGATLRLPLNPPELLRVRPSVRPQSPRHGSAAASTDCAAAERAPSGNCAGLGSESSAHLPSIGNLDRGEAVRGAAFHSRPLCPDRKPTHWVVPSWKANQPLPGVRPR